MPVKPRPQVPGPKSRPCIIELLRQCRFLAVRMKSSPLAAAIDERTGDSPMRLVDNTLNSSPADSTTAVPLSLMQ